VLTFAAGVAGVSGVKGLFLPFCHKRQREVSNTVDEQAAYLFLRAALLRGQTLLLDLLTHGGSRCRRVWGR
jgi:hypothetical protein